MKMYCVKSDINKIVYILLSCENGYATLKGYTHRIIRKVDENLLEDAPEEFVNKDNKAQNTLCLQSQ